MFKQNQNPCASHSLSPVGDDRHLGSRHPFGGYLAGTALVWQEETA